MSPKSGQSAHKKAPSGPIARLRFLEAALAGYGEGVVIVDARGKLVFLNEAGKRLLRGEPVAGLSLPQQEERLKLRYPDGRRLHGDATPLSRALRGETVADFELIVGRLDGTEGYLSATANPVRDERGTIGGAFCVFHDVGERKRYADELRKTTAQMQAVLYALPDLMFRQAADGTYLDYYAGRPADLYAAPELFLGRRTTDVLPPPVAGLLQEAIKEALRTDLVVGLEYALTIEGEEQFFEVRISPLPGNEVLSVVRNITERKRWEERLRVRERQHDAVADLGQRGMITSDVATFLNEAVALVAQVLQVELCAVLEVLPNGQQLLLRAGVGWKEGYIGQATVEAAAESQAGYTLLSRGPVVVEDLRHETRFSRPDLLREHGAVSGVSVIIYGRERPFGVLCAHSTKQRKFTADDAYFLQCIANVLAAAVERGRGEDALREAVRALRVYARVIESSPDLISVIDRRYVYRMVNPTYSRLYMKGTDEIEGGTPADLMGEDVFEEIIRPRLDQCFAGRSIQYEEWFSYPGAGRRYMEVRYYPLFGDTQVEYVVVIARDVTERKQAEQFREEYVSLISHDLRTPLTTVMGQADLLRRLLQPVEMERESRSAEAIFKNARRMNDMIQELIESVRLEAGRLELRTAPTDILSLIAEVLERMGDSRQRARILLECPERPPPVLADAARIERVVQNLLTNALKFSPPEAAVTIRVVRSGGEAIVAVVDRGVGIAPQELPYIFERFGRARAGRRAEGLGLGLYITRLILNAHGGRVWVESTVGQGSTFYFALPLA